MKQSPVQNSRIYAITTHATRERFWIDKGGQIMEYFQYHKDQILAVKQLHLNLNVYSAVI